MRSHANLKSHFSTNLSPVNREKPHMIWLPSKLVNREEIISAIKKARQKGIGQYLDIMDSFHSTDVSTDREFQRKFNSFYRVRQRKPNWYETYYFFMEQQKGKNPSFSAVLSHLYSELECYEPSFSSKFVATHNPGLPIWDAFVLENTGIKAPYYSDPRRLLKAQETYTKIKSWYERYLMSDSGKWIVKIFDELVPKHNRISNLKKIDFVLWQTRPKNRSGKKGDKRACRSAAALIKDKQKNEA